MSEITKISVIIPVYNKEQYLAQCIDSILSQTLKEVQVVCVNDGSTDSSLNVLNDLAEKDDRVLVINQENKGTGVARNAGIEDANGEFLAFMDPDDYYPDDNCLKKLYDAATQNDADMAGGNRRELGLGIDELFANSIFTQEGVLEKSSSQLYYGHTRYIYRTKFIKDNSIRYFDSTYFEDQMFLVKAILNASKIVAVPDCVYVHRLYGRTKTVLTRELLEKKAKAVLECYLFAKTNDLRWWYSGYLKEMPIQLVHDLKRLEGRNQTIWEYLDEIFEIEKEWLGDVREEKWSPKLLEERLEQAYKEAEELKKVLLSGNQVVIYGAGYAAGLLVSYLKKCKDPVRIIGLAQTSEDGTKSAFGYSVKTLDEYRDIRKDAQVIIVVIDKTVRATMKEYAHNIGFEKVMALDMEKLFFIDFFE